MKRKQRTVGRWMGVAAAFMLSIWMATGACADAGVSDEPKTDPMLEQMHSGEPFQLWFYCTVEDQIGTFYCDRPYTVQLVQNGNAWKVCGDNKNGSTNCWSYDNAPAGSESFSAWGMVLVMGPDGRVYRDGQVFGRTDLEGASKRRPPRKLPKLSEKPPKLGMPDNRQGTGGGLWGRFGYH